MRATTARSLLNGCGLLAALGFAGQVGAAPIGPDAYLQASDSPIAGSGYDYFYLEDFEDSVLNTPGVSASGSGLCISPFNCFNAAATDSVDADDGAIDGSGNGGHTQWASGSVTFTFDAAALGELPNAVGVVWTDGVNPITFEVFDENDVLLATIVGNHADGDFGGGTAEDRFYGFTSSVGIASIRISDPSGIEVDHLQYGFRGTITPPVVPEPASIGLLFLGLSSLLITRRRRG